jgi:hypothetical protein
VIWADVFGASEELRFWNAVRHEYSPMTRLPSTVGH